MHLLCQPLADCHARQPSLAAHSMSLLTGSQANDCSVQLEDLRPDQSQRCCLVLPLPGVWVSSGAALPLSLDSPATPTHKADLETRPSSCPP